MVSLTDMQNALGEICAYQDAHPHLQQCAGFLYNAIDLGDRAIQAEEPVDVIIMGMNPGENPKHKDNISPNSKNRWRSLCEEFSAPLGKSWVMSELFFWSSNNLGVLRQRVNDCEKNLFENDLSFCAKLNKRLIAFHSPKIVLQPGLTWSGYAREHYDLTLIQSVPGRRGTLIEHHVLPDGTPWLITPHWTSAFGFSKDDRDKIKDYALRAITA
ncbi:hypothetical protein [Asticcacaulis sp. AC402]|uniref:hypothetical protein n=1 Tax=Asticcacaulis sp. AC402 TaxID=1282361 RepID=UPI0012DD8C65|nr:hypothetical protein [Asticcacaulis sp. AC402]